MLYIYVVIRKASNIYFTFTGYDYNVLFVTTL